jgi:hypothetical protein
MDSEKAVLGVDEGNYLLEVSRRAHFIRAGSVGLLGIRRARSYRAAFDASS